MPELEQLDQLITLKDAATRFEISEQRLKELIISGQISAAILPDGTIGVNIDMTRMIVLNERLQEIHRDQFNHLNDSWIEISDATRKYGVVSNIIRGWILRRFIDAKKDRHPSLVNEGDMAYCTAIYTMRTQYGLKQGGAPLLDEDGAPYTVRHPRLPGRRKRKKIVTDN